MENSVIMAGILSNFTDMNMTTPMAEMAPEPTPLWIVIFDNFQLAITILGIFSNGLTLWTLIKNGDDFSEIICMLLKYQAVLDCLVCIFGVFLFNMPSFWGVGNYTVDLIICQVWHGQYIYWASVLISIWNLVALAVERYICVCMPLKYALLTKGKVRIMLLICLAIGLIGPSGSLFQVRMDGDKCVSEFLWDTPAAKRGFAVFAVSTFFSFYAIPCALFFFLYGMVIYRFKQRAKSSLGASGTASVIDKASSELTKTAVVVTVIFIVCYTYENWSYMLSYLGYSTYKMNSPIQKIGAVMSVANSVVNPFVYASLMPVYRRSVERTFLKPCLKPRTP